MLQKIGNPDIREEPKNKQITLRATQTTLDKIQKCSEDIGMTKTDVLEYAINDFFERRDNIKMTFKDEIRNFINQFNGNYELIDYGFPNGNYYDNGFWFKLKANFHIEINSFNMGKIKFTINKDTNTVYINRGFLNDIGQGLAMICNSSSSK